jgi:site-specific DNA-methyltransferase (adenine-specific)
MSPVWAAEILVKLFFPTLSNNDFVVEPTCGDGRFLNALPADTRAIGYEIDHQLAEQARINTGREVVCCDFLEAHVPVKPTAIIGNPPFKLDLFKLIIERAADLLSYGDKAGFIVPAYFLQTASTVNSLNKHFSLSQSMLPRNLWDGMEKPCTWLMLERSRRPTLSGFILYQETADMRNLNPKYRGIFIGNSSSASVWVRAIEKALQSLGGEASLADIYSEIEGRQPTKTKHWKAQIRKVARQKFLCTKPATYRIKPTNHSQLIMT